MSWWAKPAEAHERKETPQPVELMKRACLHGNSHPHAPWLSIAVLHKASLTWFQSLRVSLQPRKRLSACSSRPQVCDLSLIREDSISIVLDRARGTRQARGRFHPDKPNTAFVLHRAGWLHIVTTVWRWPQRLWTIAVSSVSLWGRLGFSFWRFILEFNHPSSLKIL